DICTGDDACQTGACVGVVIPQAPIVEQAGSKYILVTPVPSGPVPPVAIQVTSPDWPCLNKYVNASGLLVDAPVFRTPDDWGTIPVRGMDIAPSSQYDARVLCGGFVSDPGSITTAIFGDLVGDFVNGAWTPPDGDVDILDLTAVADAFRNKEDRPPLEWTDIAPCTPDRLIDIVDMIWTVDAFKSKPYPCDPPCP
ncbi:MAG: hypothetical protein D6788_04835, partial [Planctomycetota bacterium]